MARYLKDVLNVGEVFFVQLAVALQEAKPGIAYPDLTLPTGDILPADLLELFQIFKGDVIDQVIKGGSGTLP